MADLLISFFIAALSGMGVGSGGLLVLWLTHGDGLGQTQAQGINLLFFLFAASASCAVNFRRRHISHPSALLLGVGGTVGAVAGALLASAAAPELLRRLFGGMLIVTGAPALFRAAASFWPGASRTDRKKGTGPRP